MTTNALANSYIQINSPNQIISKLSISYFFNIYSGPLPLVSLPETECTV